MYCIIFWIPIQLKICFLFEKSRVTKVNMSYQTFHFLIFKLQLLTGLLSQKIKIFIKDFFWLTCVIITLKKCIFIIYAWNKMLWRIYKKYKKGYEQKFQNAKMTRNKKLINIEGLVKVLFSNMNSAVDQLNLHSENQDCKISI